MKINYQNKQIVPLNFSHMQKHTNDKKEHDGNVINNVQFNLKISEKKFQQYNRSD